MTQINPVPGNDSGLPKLSDIHFKALLIIDLFAALERLESVGGVKSGPVFAVVRAAQPIARELADELGKVM